jgi:PmbA protein
MQDYRNLAADLVAALKKQGADAADVYIVANSNFNTTVRLGKIEKLQQSISKGLGLRVFKGGATALTFTTDFAGKATKDLVAQTMDIVKVSNADKYNGLAPKEFLGAYEGKLMLFDESLAKVPTEKKIAFVKEAEEIGMQSDKRITNSNGASWSNNMGQLTLATSEGFVGQYRTTSASMSVVLLAEQDGVKYRDGWYTFNRFFNKLDSAKQVGEEAARRAVRRIGGRKVKSQIVPVVVDREVASEFVDAVFGAASGGNIYRKASFFVGKIGEEVASPLVTIIDDATMADGPACRPFDAEGVKSSQVTALEKGILKTYVCDSYSARRLDLKPTGNASRSYQSLPGVSSTNLYMKAGPTDPKDIIKSVKSGLYLTELNGQGFNPVTGDMSRGAVGFWIENGEITYPVQEITMAGNALKMLKSISAIGNDLTFKLGSTAAPTLLISEATIGGA